MFTIPIIDNNGESQTYGSEFDQMYELELKGNLQSPLDPVIDYNTGSKYTLYDDTGGVYNQARLFENNDDPKEDQQTTDQQALQRIRNMAGINRQLTETEKRYNLYTTDNYDIRFRDALVNESIKNNDNIFSEFSQDHVNSIRASNTNQYKEENLYDTPETAQSRLLSSLNESIKGNMGGDITSFALNSLMSMAKQEQQQQTASQAFRDRQMPKPIPTMTEKFNARMTGRPVPPLRDEL